MRPLAKNVERSIEKPLHFDKCILYQILEGVGLLSISRLVDNINTPMHAQYGLITLSGYRDILVQLQSHSWRLELYNIILMSTGREVSATNSPRRLEAPK